MKLSARNRGSSPHLSIAAFLSLSACPLGAAAGEGWPGFRGPGGSGASAGEAAPVRWSLQTGENVRWKRRIPGLAHSSPVVWKGRLFITTAVREQGEGELKVGLYGAIEPVEDASRHAWRVISLDEQSGEPLWERTAHEGVPKIRRHPKASHASSTPAAGGGRVVAFFGAEGLYCYDLDGNLVWSKDLGRLDSGYFRVPSAQWGFGSSPVVHDGRVIVQCDVQEDSFIAAFALEDGSELWRTPRRDVPSWSTPAVHADGKDGGQVIVNGFRHIGGYDLSTGKELWKLRGGGDIPVPTPVISGGLVFITNAHGGPSPIYAVKLEARGDITPAAGAAAGGHLAWSRERGGNYMQTPIVLGEHLYLQNDRGVLSCYEASSGERLYQERVGAGASGFTSSPVAAGGNLYLTSEEGEVHVIEAGAKFRVLAVNQLGETCLATPAISRGTLFFRTRGQVVAVGHGSETGQ
jgi:outer membrane protein assembly factor BamB